MKGSKLSMSVKKMLIAYSFSSENNYNISFSKKWAKMEKRKRSNTKPYGLQVGQMIFLSSHEGPREKLYPKYLWIRAYNVLTYKVLAKYYVYRVDQEWYSWLKKFLCEGWVFDREPLAVLYLSSAISSSSFRHFMFCLKIVSIPIMYCKV